MQANGGARKPRRGAGREQSAARRTERSRIATVEKATATWNARAAGAVAGLVSQSQSAQFPSLIDWVGWEECDVIIFAPVCETLCTIDCIDSARTGDSGPP